MELSKYVKQESFRSPARKALLNVLVTDSWLSGELNAVMNEYDLTKGQYNVLRVLHGSHPKRLTCTGISQRLLDRTPDVTRLLNRLEGRNFVHRRKAAHDRRCIEVGITQAGQEHLAKMQPDVQETLSRLTKHLTPEEHRTLSNLLEKMRTDQ